MSSTETRTDAIWDELLDAEIPCGNCGKPAMLRSRGHGCPTTKGIRPPFFSCLSCWQPWLSSMIGDLAQYGSIRCAVCNHQFLSVESFSDFRPF